MRTNFFLWMALIMVCVGRNQGEYKEVASVPGGLTIVERNGKYGVVDENGKLLLKIKYDSISRLSVYDYFSDNNDGIVEVTNEAVAKKCLLVGKDGKYGLYNIKWRNFVLDCKYDSISDDVGIEYQLLYNDDDSITSSIINGYKEGKWHDYYCNDKEHQVFEYEYVGSGTVEPHGLCVCDCGLVMFRKNGKYGFLEVGKHYNKKDLAKLAVYDETKSLYGDGVVGVMSVKQNGKWGAVDGAGRLMIPCEYEDVVVGYDWANLVEVKQNGKWGLVDMKGKKVLDCEYDKIVGWYNIPTLCWHGGGTEQFDLMYDVWVLKKMVNMGCLWVGMSRLLKII